MKSFKEKQLELIQNLGDVMYFSYDLQRVNRLAKTKQKELVKNAENFYIWQLEQIADNIVNKKSKIVLVAGPSSAGKTTSSFEIKRALKKRGINAHVVSMDDFFVNKIDTPLLPDGSYDFENVTAVDIPYFKKFLKDILAGKVANVPFYDFILGQRTMLTPMKVEDDEVIIIEGLHALNPICMKGLAKQNFYKVFVAVASNFTIGNEVIVHPKQIRFMRRLLRDYYKRGSSVSSTVEHWRKVVHGETKYILPFKPEADFILNTTHLYEPLLYDKYLQPVVAEHPTAPEIKELLEIFKHTGTIDEKFVPQHSLIREFLP
ncbi:MAG: nucleoside kinase [Clostridia bacterium]|nr:nucleoside kinase [Clostridia bacterium]